MSLRGAPTLGQLAVGRDNNFNLLRVFAASGVIFSHAYPLTLGPGTPEPLSGLIGATLGHVCVLIFFATSGFFITASFERKKSMLDFLLARILRIFPGLLIMACVTLLVLGFVSTQPEAYQGALPERILATVLLFAKQLPMPGLFETLPYPQAINGSLWTLKFEVLCYGAVVLAGLLGIFRAPRITAALVLVLAVLRVGLDVVQIAPNGVFFYIHHLIKLGFPFALGAAAYVYRDQLPLSLTLAGAMWLVNGAVLATLGHESALFAMLFALALTYTVFWFGYAGPAKLRGYNRLGDYSYGIYIYAFPIQQLLVQLELATTPMANACLSLLVSVVLAVLSWHLVEKPSMRLRVLMSGRSLKPSRGTL